MAWQVVDRSRDDDEAAYALAGSLGLNVQASVAQESPVAERGVFVNLGFLYAVVTTAGAVVALSDAEANALLRAVIGRVGHGR